MDQGREARAIDLAPQMTHVHVEQIRQAVLLFFPHALGEARFASSSTTRILMRAILRYRSIPGAASRRDVFRVSSDGAGHDGGDGLRAGARIDGRLVGAGGGTRPRTSGRS